MSYLTEDDSPLVRHAREELERAGVFNDDMDYGDLVPKAVLELISTFAHQGLSGMSASIVQAYFDKLVRWETLTSLTSDPNEWIDRSDISNIPLWQSRRNPAVMSEDGGKTHYHVDRSKEIITTQAPRELMTSE